MARVRRLDDLVTLLRSKTAVEQSAALFAGYAADPVNGEITMREFLDGSTMFAHGSSHRERRKLLNQLLRPDDLDAQNAEQVIKSGGSTNYPMVLNGGLNIYFNTKKPPFNDVRARQAIALAIDPKDYAKVVNGGLQEPIDSVFRHDSPFFDPTIVQQFNNPTLAQTLLDQLAAERGGPLNFTMTAFPVQNYQLSAQYVQGVVNKLRNVKMDIVTEASSLHITKCTAGQYDSACGYGGNWSDPEPGWTGQFTCAASPSPTGWCNAKFDAAVKDNQQALDPKVRVAAIKEAQKQFYADVPVIYLERRYSWDFAAPNIQDFQYTNDGLPLLGRMWIKTS